MFGAPTLPTTQALESDPGTIRFVVMPDRTGGMREGIFKDALEKANLLHPEFVMSVGDLIDGYTLDPKLLDAQWKEFDDIVEGIDVPFFYVPGNHDISNTWMEEEWKRRLGDPYYHFVYKDVLFLSLHTEDGGVEGLSDAQVEYFEDVLAEHKDVRWTFLFMHRPLWSYGEKQGLEHVLRALEGRRYTLFSGHHHNYYYEPDASGNERFILGTAGGGSHLRGETFGEFDHVTYVAFTGEEVKVTHLELDGFVAKDIVNPKNRVLIETLRGGGFARVTAKVSERPDPARLDGELVVRNSEDSVLGVEIQFPELEGLEFVTKETRLEIPARSSLNIPFRLEVTGGGDLNLDDLPPIQLSIVGRYDFEGDVLELPTSKLWRIDWPRQVSGAGEEAFEWVRMDPPGYFEEGWDWLGPQDCRLRFAFIESEKGLELVVEGEDDLFILRGDRLSDRFTLFFETDLGRTEWNIVLRPNGRVEVPDILKGKVAWKRSGRGLNLRVMLPYDILGIEPNGVDPSFRFNLRYLDHDRPENEKPSRLYWHPAWNSAENFEGSGRIVLKAKN
ncbi:metallophosphoesterase [Pelagicoccus mobilis]|uniref:Metallophosphoesterase n=2 Tax=Pelagicoccus mobilis TaxID=415221 RepID=A0A934S6F4_9BACT|nr:metallophosphoesterase [Pelagicoccus mobilis]